MAQTLFFRQGPPFNHGHEKPWRLQYHLRPPVLYLYSGASKLIFSVNPISQTLPSIPDINAWIHANRQALTTLEQDLDYADRFTCTVRKVRIVEVLRGTKNHPTKLFYGPILQLNFDPNRYGWPSGAPLLQYSTKTARSWIRTMNEPVNLSRTRWRGTLLGNTHVDWKDT